MKTPRLFVVVAGACASLLLVSACGSSISVSFGNGITGSGELVTQTYDVDDFDAIDVSSAFEVAVTVGDEYFVEVTANENLVDKLEVEVRDGELRVGLEDGTSLRSGTLEATVRVPEVVAVDVSGASSVRVDGLFGSDIRFDASGASDLEVSGTASNLTIDASGASSLDLRIDDVSAAVVDLSGASSVDLRSATRVTGSLSGASNLTIPDDATTIDLDTSGASSIHRS